MMFGEAKYPNPAIPMHIPASIDERNVYVMIKLYNVYIYNIEKNIKNSNDYLLYETMFMMLFSTFILISMSSIVCNM